ncbi:MAG: electron transfer flavoprotein subunit alpha/FixB family protein [Nitrososphaerales archaeon]
MAGVLVYSDNVDTVLELVTLGGKLGRDVSVAVLGAGEISEKIAKASVSGVTVIYQVSNDSLKDLSAGPLVDALAAVCLKAGPDLVLVGSTKRGREIAPRLATRLNLACISDALKVELDGNDATVERLVWGGNAIATITSKGAAVVTIPRRANERASGQSSPTIIIADFEPKPNRVKILEVKAKPRGQVNLKDAEIIVSAGRGFKKKEDLAILDDLAKTLDAVTASSRPLASDLGWVPEDRQVGLSGTLVKPKLYLAVGISGQIQHLTGMRDSKLVAAINTDKAAPIFQECDYGIVGDLYAVVPELTKAFKEKLGR